MKKLFPPFFPPSFCYFRPFAARNSWCKLRPYSGHLNVQLACARAHPPDAPKFILDLDMHLRCQYNRDEHDKETSPSQENLDRPAFKFVWECRKFLTLTSVDCASPIPTSVTIALAPNLVTSWCLGTGPRWKAFVGTSHCTCNARVSVAKCFTRAAHQVEGTQDENAHGLNIRHDR